LSSSFLTKKIKINTPKNIILPVVLCGCETWSLTLREECRLGVFEKVVRGMFGPKRDEVTGSGEKYNMRTLPICNPHQILFW
jgi:hypothetical protein